MVSALLAPQCAACRAILDEPLAGPVCKNCWAAILPITPPVCDACGDPLARPSQSHIPNHEYRQQCRGCRERDRVLDRARAVGEYSGALREIIHAFKYEKRRSLAAPLAALMGSGGRELLDEADCIVPVPLHRRRERARGFNQARDLARDLGLPLIEPLRRTRATPPQIELAARLRQANVKGAFALRRTWFRERRQLGGLKVLLVDDVSTTGATLEACATVLKEAGASEVYALTAARVITRRH
jgi:ComF family protein